ncbi:CBS domain-containing protein [Halobacillus kuroshimensis]|uniref:CBS domain-containing protein n=2 Tax=Halobacillus kuroshimensis TaxID=302481 RepID=A0ABS3DTP5_9BACI|nr:CBS domain-containing protein [Halobacillus kuroshimensis]MBN8234710.1 CBS domain-containing protein [Halobacillus kuroshimensis]
MFVKGIMKPVHQSFTADVNTSLKDVLELLEQKDIEAVPVLEGNLFKGMISKEMIYESCYKKAGGQDTGTFLEETPAGEAAGYEDFCITNEEVFERTLPMFKGFAVLAVVDDHRVFQGLVTRYDVIEQFESAFGVKKQGIRIAFTSEESEGRIERLGDIIKNYHENVISLATFDETDKLARRIVLKIEENDNIEAFTKKLEKSGFRILSVKHV